MIYTVLEIEAKVLIHHALNIISTANRNAGTQGMETSISISKKTKNADATAAIVICRQPRAGFKKAARMSLTIVLTTRNPISNNVAIATPFIGYSRLIAPKAA